jgi:type I restriction enzyme R subunit
MAGDERQLVEAPALDQLKGLGWSHLDGTTLVPEKSNHRSSLKDVVLTPNLEQAIQRINPWINEDNLRKVVREVSLIQTATLMEANQWFWERLTQYFSVEPPATRKDVTPLNRKPGGLMEQSNASLQRGDQG